MKRHTYTMAKITEKQLICQLKELKEIKPRKEWAVLLKSQILAEKAKIEAPQETYKAKLAGLMSMFPVFTTRRLAYALAVVLILIVGVFSVANYTVPGDLLFPVKKIAEQSQAALSGKTILNQDMTVFSNRVNDLAQIAKEGKTNNIPSVISEISANASQLVKNLKANPISDPNTIKEIATSLKTLADVLGTDLSTNNDVENLYQTIVESQINDLRKATLTDDQKAELLQVEDLYNQGNYQEALDIILTQINK